MSKYILVFILLLAVSSKTFCQQTNPAAPFSREDYLKKSKGQKTAAWVLAGAGTAFVSAGAAIGFGEALNSLGNLFSNDPEPYNNTADILFYSGAVMLAGSIPFFILAGSNKQKANAMSASFKLEDRWQPAGMAMSRKYYPALSLRIALNKN